MSMVHLFSTVDRHLSGEEQEQTYKTNLMAPQPPASNQIVESLFCITKSLIFNMVQPIDLIFAR